MTLFEQIKQDQITAMKSGDEHTRDVLRVIVSMMKNLLIDRRLETLTDEDVLTVLRQQVKQLTDAMQDFEKGGRADLVEANKKEIETLSVYLPAQLNEEEVKSIVATVVQKSGATSPNDLGKVMGMVMKEVAGRADGNMIRTRVLATLSQE